MTAFDTQTFTQIPNNFLDDYMVEMHLSELKVVLSLLRMTLGYHRSEVRLSISKLAKLTGLSRQAVYNGAESAVRRGLFQWKRNKGVTIWKVNLIDDIGISKDKTVEQIDNNCPLSRPPSIKEIKLNNKGKKGGNKNHSSPTQKVDLSNQFSAAGSKYLRSLGRDKWKNENELLAFQELEAEVGQEVLLKAINWAIPKKIHDLNRITKAARTIQKSSPGDIEMLSYRSEPKGFAAIREIILERELTNGE